MVAPHRAVVLHPDGRASTLVGGPHRGGAVVGTWSAVTADDLRVALFLGATRGGAAVLVVAVALSLLWHRRRRTVGGPAASS